MLTQNIPGIVLCSPALDAGARIGMQLAGLRMAALQIVCDDTILLASC